MFGILITQRTPSYWGTGLLEQMTLIVWIGTRMFLTFSLPEEVEGF